MTASRAVAIGAARARRRAASRSCCCGGNGEHTYRLTFETAGQLVNDNDVQIGGRRIGSVKKIELTDNNQVADHDRRQGAVRAAARRHDRDHPRDLAVRRRQPLHLAVARRRTATPSFRTTRSIPATKTTTDRRPRPALQHLRPERRAKGLQDVIQGFGDWYAGRGPEGNQVAKYFAPSLRRLRGVVEKVSRRPARRSRRSCRTPRRSSRRSASARPTLTDLVTNTNTSLGAIASENASLAAGARLPAADAAPREHDVREPARDARRPRQARRGLEAGSRRTSRRSSPTLRAAADRGHADGRPARDAAASSPARRTTSPTC